MAKSPEEMAASMRANIPEKTGRTLEEWRAIVGASGLEKHGQIVKLLKSEHGVTHGFANLIAHEVRGSSALQAGGDELIDAQYAASKAALRPIYDALAKAVADFGEDVELSPKKTYVSLRRSKQFGLIKPSTRTRVDLGINLKEAAATARLQPAGSLGMVSHKVALASVDEVDDELVGWLRQAYAQA
jgi:predicted transport protein